MLHPSPRAAEGPSEQAEHSQNVLRCLSPWQGLPRPGAPVLPAHSICAPRLHRATSTLTVPAPGKQQVQGCTAWSNASLPWGPWIRGICGAIGTQQVWKGHPPAKVCTVVGALSTEGLWIRQPHRNWLMGPMRTALLKSYIMKICLSECWNRNNRKKARGAQWGTKSC